MSATHNRFRPSTVTSRCTKTRRVSDVFALPVVTGDLPLPVPYTLATRITRRVYSRPYLNTMALACHIFPHPIHRITRHMNLADKLNRSSRLAQAESRRLHYAIHARKNRLHALLFNVLHMNSTLKQPRCLSTICNHFLTFRVEFRGKPTPIPQVRSCHEARDSPGVT